MSVICQNFVQNAWKKDLCSNCFKSVGDHENSDSMPHNEVLNSNQSDSLNGRYVSQAANVYPSRSNATPHTTWKSLISEKNGKNSQPFKLETGFQGRLLTINKANGTEKKSPNEVKVNGHTSKSQTVNNANPSKILNGHTPKQSTTKSQPSNGIKSAYNKSENKTNCNGLEKHNPETNGEEIKNDTKQEAMTNGDATGMNGSHKEKPSEKKPKYTKSKSEEAPTPPNLHSILKKTISSPPNGNSQSRRGSNVGFKDEEPLVIGYGGRDFSPEELEWEMASSDGETENASDSLDEEDREFLKKTKQNTEFNSDNANLLQKSKSNDKARKHANKAEVNDKNKSSAKIIKRNENTRENPKAESKQNGINPKPNNKNEECNDNKSKTIDQKKSAAPTFSEATNCTDKSKSNDKDDECNAQQGGRGNTEKSESQCNGNNFSNGGSTAIEQIKGKIVPTINGKNDSINVAVKSDKTSHAATFGEVTVVKTTEAADSRVDVKNSSEFINGAASPSCAVSAQNTSDGTATEETADTVMFSDSGEQNWQDNAPLEGNAEWSENDVLPGQILQAINTSLANRHKMRDSPKEENDILAADDEHTSSLQEGTREKNEMVSSKSLPVNDCAEIDSSDVSRGKLERTNEEELTESTMNVEPRASFLHGIVSSNRASKPSAIYGPASDLFVSRSNSSSSSSSDELSKSQVSLSINVIVNGGDTSEHSAENEDPEEENENAEVSHEESNTENSTISTSTNKPKPKIPAKPSKSNPSSNQKDRENETYPKEKFKDDKLNLMNNRKPENIIQERTYYSSTTEGPRSITLIDHYAESNIYHEVNDKDVKISNSEEPEKVLPAREYKLAALAIELEQVRTTNGTKRQAPAPPKIPDPPLEDPPSCAGRTSPPIDAPHGFSTFRGESMAFSSASSTTSTSSQDTETGYASWNLQGDMDENPKYSKSKSSFLLTQYSKCKMLAMGYAEDSARARKKFSLKKLLKIGKESEAPVTFDPSSPNPKAWKYSDHFERPRAKLEIIHPMDLENKSVTVNPGFDSLHNSSMSSFTASADDISFRNSVSSDYGSYYSDTMSPAQDLKSEANYEYIQPRQSTIDEQEDLTSLKNGTINSNSPTPSRSSLASQASTLTSGSSKNSSTPPHRPPKPPPPPRAHSLLPGNKAFRNSDGTFKFPGINDEAVNGEEVRTLPPKPQAPKRQCKSAVLRSDYANFEEPKTIPIQESDDTTPTNENIQQKDETEKLEEKIYESVASVQIGSSEKQENTYSDVLIKSEAENKYEEKEVTLSQPETSSPPVDKSEEDITLQNTSIIVEGGESDYSTSVISEMEPKIQTSISIKTTAPIQKEKISKSMLSRNKHPPITKAPARPPPIYSKPQTGNFARSTVPWKTLEDSYLALTSSNRELLIKLVNKALTERKASLAKLQKMKFQWADFEIDTNQPSSVFAFGEKIAYHANMPKNPEYSVTLVITIQQQQNRLNENNDFKYPVFGQFTDHIPSELLDGSSDGEIEPMQATVLVLDHSNISTIECFTESLPDSLTDDNEKELCFIILQLIQSLKSLQAQGIETMDTSFQNLVLAKSKEDKFHTLIFLSDNCYDECDYSSDTCKISLCQYALMLLLQMLKIQSVDELPRMSATKFASNMAKRVFEAAISLLSEEKAVSLSQTKTLLECFLWGITKVLESTDNFEELDNMLHRWLDIERSHFIKQIINDEKSSINTKNEYYSHFLIRTSVRNIREVASYL